MNLYKKHLNGILADETGLGKTVQTVAYMAHLAGQEGQLIPINTHSVWMSAVILFPSFFSGYKDVVYVLLPGVWGPHLIVVRTCKLLNWEVEFKRWCPGLKILLYFGNRRERRSLRAVGLLLHFFPLLFFNVSIVFDAPTRLQRTDCKFANIMDSFIRSGGEEPTASMCA